MNPNEYHIDRLKQLGKQNDIFIFKQFRLRDNHSTMRVGTDAILLGIATDLDDAVEVLEIGTGSGVISLILAQRSRCMIDAIEIDAASAAQAAENIAGSPWPDRIRVIHTSLQDYTRSTDKTYDRIVSNPPFFSRSFKSECSRRNLSRHNDKLPFDELIAASGRLLAEHGALWVILPVREGREFIQKALSGGFYLYRRIMIIPKEGKDPNRMVMGFSKERPHQVKESELVLRNPENDFHPQYKAFAADFYIDF